MLITVLALMLVIPGQAYALTNFYFALPAPIDENTLRGANFTVEYPWPITAEHYSLRRHSAMKRSIM